MRRLYIFHKKTQSSFLPLRFFGAICYDDFVSDIRGKYRRKEVL